MKFRHLLQTYGLMRTIFERINAHLIEKGLLLHRGTIVDASLIAAPSSTKNKDKARDPQMHQSKKGNQWYFGLKAHIGVDAESGLVHSVVLTPGNVADVSQAHALLHGKEQDALGDAGYQGVEKRAENAGTKVNWHTAMRPGKRKCLGQDKLGRLQEQYERAKASIRAKVEHPFHVVKNLFGHRKTRYRGLSKNAAQFYVLFALANLVRVKRKLLPFDTQVAS